MLSAGRQAAGGLLQQADQLLAAAAQVTRLLPRRLQQASAAACSSTAIACGISSNGTCQCWQHQQRHEYSSSSPGRLDGFSTSGVQATTTSSSSSSGGGSASRHSQQLSRWPLTGHLGIAMQHLRTFTASSRRPAAAKSQAPDALAPADSVTSSSSTAVADPASSASEAAAAAGGYQRSRFKQFYEQQVARELLLKANIRNPHHLPRIRQVHAIISSHDIVGKSLAEKWRLLLPALALEYITGQPAQYATSTNKYYSKRNLVTGVHVSLAGRDAYDFLEKLVTLVLPSQNAFDGIMLKTLDKQHHVHFKVANMGNFPDFEDQYEMFEALRVMHVTITMDGVSKSPAYTQMLLTAMGLPLLRRIKVVGGMDEAFGDPVAAAAAADRGEGVSSDGDEEKGVSSSDEE